MRRKIIQVIVILGIGILLSLNSYQIHATSVENTTGKADYFVSTDTVIIGCTAGAAAGLLAGSLPLMSTLITGVGITDSLFVLSYLTGLGCGVGAASGIVAVLTAVLIEPFKNRTEKKSTSNQKNNNSP